jgi:hypothetical protein
MERAEIQRHLTRAHDAVALVTQRVRAAPRRLLAAEAPLGRAYLLDAPKAS